MSSSATDNDPRKFLRKYRVFLDLNERQAPGHDDLFNDIAELGKYTIENYRSPVSIESNKRPWGQTEMMLRRVKAISAKARRCLKAEKNEAGWRLGLESEILSRFDIEVVCSECRVKLWRAELEVAVTDSTKSLDGLNERQQRRKQCKCLPRGFGEDRWDHGENTLFDDRAEEGIEHEEEIEKILKKSKGKKPDRVIGLRATKRIERILYDAQGIGQQRVVDCVKTTPFKNCLDPLLFPFLVLEAKSEKSSDAFSKIYLQTAFAIRALLNLQRNLKNVTFENRQSSVEPLVWFLANRGEDWRVYGAYIEVTDRCPEPNYRILELWAGNITYEDKALALLLIIDYISDWARDVYRRNIINNLLSLTTNSTPSLAADTDIDGTAHNILLEEDGGSLGTEVVPGEESSFSVPHLLRFFDDDGFALRDAGYMHWDFCGLCITQENLDKLLKSANNPREAQQFSRRIWRSISSSDSWSVSAACLSATEELWTGRSRDHEVFQNPDQRFLAVFFIRSYFVEGDDPRNIKACHGMRLGQWEQHHELTFIAVSEDAIQTLEEYAAFKPWFLQLERLQLERSHVPEVSHDWLIKTFQAHRFASVRSCLLKAVSHSTFQSCYEGIHRQATSEERGFTTPQPRRWMDIYNEPFFKLSAAVSNSIGLPWLVYKRFKVGMSEPDEPFLRVSHMHGKDTSTRAENAVLESQVLPQHKLENINVVIVFDAKLIHRESATSRKCIFMLDGLDRDERRKVLPYALQTKFQGRGMKNESFATVVRKHENLESFVKFLNHVSTQYQLLRSLKAGVRISDLSAWALGRYDLLEAWQKTRWPYNLAATVSGIQTVGEACLFDSLLRNLLAASDALVKKISIDAAVQHLELAFQDCPSLSLTSFTTRRSQSSIETNQITNSQGDEEAGTGPKKLSFASTSTTLSKRQSEIIDLTDSLTDNEKSSQTSDDMPKSASKSASQKRRRFR